MIPYDYEAGDRGSFSWENAIEAAVDRARWRGRRQQVRHYGKYVGTGWVIQDVR